MRAALGIDVGGTKLLASVVDGAGRTLAEALAASPDRRADLVASLASVATDALGALGPGSVDLVGVGLGLPGLIDRAGILHETPNLQAAQEMAIDTELEPALRAACAGWFDPAGPPLRMVAENDATCAAAGELCFGAARGAADAVVVALGTGVGAGVIAGGRLVLGGQGFAGEVGHMVVETNGVECVCGGRGCWEQYTSGSAIGRAARELAAAGDAPRILELAGGAIASVRAEEVVTAAREGDGPARAVMRTAAEYLAVGFSNLAELLDPEVIVVSGGLSEAEDVLVAPAIELFARRRRGSGPRAVRVRRAQLGARAGVVGAAAVALGRC